MATQASFRGRAARPCGRGTGVNTANESSVRAPAPASANERPRASRWREEDAAAPVAAALEWSLAGADTTTGQVGVLSMGPPRSLGSLGSLGNLGSIGPLWVGFSGTGLGGRA